MPRRALLLPIVLAVLGAGVWVAPRASSQAAGGCDDPRPEWLMCEDFEDGDRGWSEWFADSAFTECIGCRDGVNDPDRIQLVDDRDEAHSGDWSLYMPAEEEADFQGAALTYRDCAGSKRPGCRLNGHEQLYYRTFVRLADDHEYVHHFLSVGGTRPNGYWEGDGNAGCRPNGYRSAGTTVDFNSERELFFYTYFPDMRCDRGGYCSGAYAQRICDGCARKDMPCSNGPECCWGNHFGPEEPVLLERGRWVCLEMTMKLNTPGEADGEMAFWVDDELAHRQSGMHWRDVPELQLNKAWLQHYIARDDADQSNRIWFDDMVVSTERIGCAVAVEAPTEPGTGAVTESPTAPGTGSVEPSLTATVRATDTTTPTHVPSTDWWLHLPAILQ